MDASVAALIERLTAQLAELANQLDGSGGSSLGGLPAGTDREVAQAIIDQRMARFDHFPADLFHEPAWDMLLALFVAHEERRTMNVKQLVAKSKAPATTSQRWIDHLHTLKLIERVIDTEDRRRIEVSLSQQGQDAMRAYVGRIAADHAPPASRTKPN